MALEKVSTTERHWTSVEKEIDDCYSYVTGNALGGLHTVIMMEKDKYQNRNNKMKIKHLEEENTYFYSNTFGEIKINGRKCHGPCWDYIVVYAGCVCY